ncbi:Ohr family peroxiredoxin, partial [Microbispora sp. ATCC PTA-5024]|uniref:Ohr family peroxiredoxin n=1 Tax=Microbispora sp. ATCC PTA-5024 TaxID=316330 RepID=UPI0003DBAAB4
REQARPPAQRPAADRGPAGRVGVYDDLYTGRAVSTKAGVVSDDGLLDLRLRDPEELGGPGGAPNPEQLLAAAYAACFRSSLALVAGRQGADTSEATVEAAVTLRKRGVADDYAITADVVVRLPNVKPEVAQRLVRQAHRECPYSRAFEEGADVAVRVG